MTTDILSVGEGIILIFFCILFLIVFRMIRSFSKDANDAARALTKVIESHTLLFELIVNQQIRIYNKISDLEKNYQLAQDQEIIKEK